MQKDWYHCISFQLKVDCCVPSSLNIGKLLQTQRVLICRYYSQGHKKKELEVTSFFFCDASLQYWYKAKVFNVHAIRVWNALPEKVVDFCVFVNFQVWFGWIFEGCSLWVLLGFCGLVCLQLFQRCISYPVFLMFSVKFAWLGCPPLPKLYWFWTLGERGTAKVKNKGKKRYPLSLRDFF